MKLLQGDCLELMKDIPDKSVDMILCDLPYGTTACKWDTIINFDKLWEQYERIIKDNGAIVLTSSQPFTSALVMSNPKLFKHEWVWNKSKASNIAQVKYAPLKDHENVVVFGRNRVVYNPQMTTGEPYYKGEAKKTDIEFMKLKRVNNVNHGTRYPKTVQRFTTAEREGKLHPTQKPVALMEYLIKTYTNEGDLVLDNCMGSGTTGVACKNLNRDFIGMELDEKYFEIATKRINFALEVN